MADLNGDDDDENLVEILAEALTPNTHSQRAKSPRRTVWRFKRYSFNASWREQNVSTDWTIIDHKILEREEDLEVEEWKQEFENKSLIKQIIKFALTFIGW